MSGLLLLYRVILCNGYRNTAARAFILTTGTTATLTIGGSLTVNGGFFKFFQWGECETVNVGGDITLSSGTLTTNASTGTCILASTGNFTASGGTWNMASGNISTTNVGGDFTLNGAAIVLQPVPAV